MKSISGETSLVIAGAWNPAILTPAWVMEHGLKRSQAEGEQVQVFMPAAPLGAFELPRYVLSEFTYMVRPDALLINPAGADSESYARAENAAAAMLEVLPHTPMNGIGHNFEFRDTSPDPAKLDVFTRAAQDVSDAIPSGWNSAQTMILSSFRNENGSVIVNVQRQFDAGSVAIKFNFHHAIANIEQALKILRGEQEHRMADNFTMAKKLVNELYGEVTND
jgi:hypothetical protein